MRTLAVFAGSFSSGIFLAQYLLPQHWLLPTACVCLLLGCGALLLPGIWRRRGVLIGTALALALGYNWLYCRQVARPMAALAGTEQAVRLSSLRDSSFPVDIIFAVPSLLLLFLSKKKQSTFLEKLIQKKKQKWENTKISVTPNFPP